MAVFADITAKEFIEKYNGKELFKEFAPKLGALPSLAYKPFYNKKCMDVVDHCVSKGLVTQAQADALIKVFNEKFADK